MLDSRLNLCVLRLSHSLILYNDEDTVEIAKNRVILRRSADLRLRGVRHSAEPSARIEFNKFN